MSPNPRLAPPAALASAVAAALAPLPAFAQEPPDVTQLAEFIRWGGVALAVPMVIGSMLVLRVIQSIATRLGERFANRRPTIQKVDSIARFAVYVATVAACFGLSIRLDSTALTVIGGALAFAVGFAMRELVASFIAGITIMFDQPFQVGDRVQFAGQYGDILTIGLRSVRMNTLDHNVVTIPNNRVLSDVTASGNYGALEMQVPLDFHVGVDQDTRLAAALILEACLTSPYVFLGQPVPILAKQVILENYVAFQIKARPYVFDCKYEKPFETDVHFRVLEAFRTHDIKPPAMLHRSLPETAALPAGTGVALVR